MVTRGHLPGIYTSKADVLNNICGIEGAHVEGFSTPNMAAVAWTQAIIGGHVVALPEQEDAILPASAILFTNPTEAHSTIFEESITTTNAIDEHSTMLEEPILWHRASHHSGTKWVVWSGRIPGVFDSWWVKFLSF